MEFTMPLPCRHFRPASMTSHFDESTMNGTLATSGSLPSNCRKSRHRRDAVNHPFVHADVDDVRAVLDLLARDGDGFLVFIFLDELRKLWRARHVRAFADHDELPDLLRERLRAAQAQGGSPMGLIAAPVENLVSVFGEIRGGLFSSALAIAAMCSGVLPQQPPAMLIKLLFANSPRKLPMSSGFKSKPVGDSGFGSRRWDNTKSRC
jgi:hypothetical protein